MTYNVIDGKKPKGVRLRQLNHGEGLTANARNIQPMKTNRGSPLIVAYSQADEKKKQRILDIADKRIAEEKRTRKKK